MTISVLKGSDGGSIIDSFYERNGRQTRARDSDIFFVAMEHREVVGAVRYCIEENVHLLRGMFIDEAYRQKGIGKLLLKEFENYLANNKITTSYCLPYGHLAHFYNLIGYKVIDPSEGPRYLQDRYRDYNKTQDTIMMKREI